MTIDRGHSDPKDNTPVRTSRTCTVCGEAIEEAGTDLCHWCEHKLIDWEETADQPVVIQPHAGVVNVLDALTQSAANIARTEESKPPKKMAPSKNPVATPARKKKQA